MKIEEGSREDSTGVAGDEDGEEVGQSGGRQDNVGESTQEEEEEEGGSKLERKGERGGGRERGRRGGREGEKEGGEREGKEGGRGKKGGREGGRGRCVSYCGWRNEGKCWHTHQRSKQPVHLLLWQQHSAAAVKEPTQSPAGQSEAVLHQQGVPGRRATFSAGSLKAFEVPVLQHSNECLTGRVGYRTSVLLY